MKAEYLLERSGNKFLMTCVVSFLLLKNILELKMIIEIVFTVSSVIGLVWAGIFIGRECGTFENFVLALLKKLENKLKGDK